MTAKRQEDPFTILPYGLQSSREAGAAGDGRSEEILDWIGLIDQALGVEEAEGWLHDDCTREPQMTHAERCLWMLNGSLLKKLGFD